MPRQRTNPYAALHEVLLLLAPLTHDELRDLADMLTADAATGAEEIPSRSGLPPLDVERGHPLILRGGWQYRDNPPLVNAPARPELVRAYEAASALPSQAQSLLVDTARMLQYAHAPIAERRITPEGMPLAEGTIQTKIIRRKSIDPDTGEVVVRAFGPYLYYRYWATGGDADKRTRRLKNSYIGRQPLAVAFALTAHGSPERREMERRIIAAMRAGTLDALEDELSNPQI